MGGGGGAKDVGARAHEREVPYGRDPRALEALGCFFFLSNFLDQNQTKITKIK